VQFRNENKLKRSDVNIETFRLVVLKQFRLCRGIDCVTVEFYTKYTAAELRGRVLMSKNPGH
jgi:hypothetical protein